MQSTKASHTVPDVKSTSRTHFDICQDDLSSEHTRNLLALHLAEMHENSPPGAVFALDLSGLLLPEVTVWTAWRNGQIAAIGALKMLKHGSAEIKSMRTSPDFSRQGAASATLKVIIDVARSRGVTQLSLETGTGPAFEPALALYRAHGFQNGAAFGDYESNGFNQFLHLRIT